MKTQGKAYTIMFTTIISFVFVAVLAAAYYSMKPLITTNADSFKMRAILNAMNIPYKDNTDAVAVFRKSVKTFLLKDVSHYSAFKNEVQILAMEKTGDGLWGKITLVVAVDPLNRKLAGIDVISHSETPGLGGRIDEAWFKAQYQDEAIPGNNVIAMRPPGTGDLDKTNGGVDAITGASRTSEAMHSIVDRAIADLISIAAEAKAQEGTP
ncbi:MAG: FMN-binding protein [Spirochaetaceae bacterium]|nr:MAG: FMN-binding protein [Spirochaetaceae bacterium]